MPQTKVRVVGSGFSLLKFNGTAIAYLDSFNDLGQEPYQGRGFEEIVTLGDRHPREFATGRVLGSGQLEVTVKELWNLPVWWSLGNQDGAAGILAGTNNIVDVWEILAAQPGELTCLMLITPPGTAGPTRTKLYHGCLPTKIDDGEVVTIGALSVARKVMLNYTHAEYKTQTSS